MAPRRWRIPPRRIAPVALVLGLTIAGFFGAALLGERDARRESEHRAEVAAAQIHGRVVDASSLAASLGRYMASVGRTGVTDEEFAGNASRWLSPAGFPAAGWVEEVGAADRAAYEQRTGHPIVMRDQRRRIVPAESRSTYLPATLVSGIPPLSVPGLDLGGDSGMAEALLRARALHQPSATPLTTLRGGTNGLFLVSLAQRGGVVEPGFAVVFVSGESLRAPAADTPAVELLVGAPAVGPAGAATVRRSFTEAGQRFDVVVPLEAVGGAAALLPWIILVAGLVLAALAAALGVSGARRGWAQEELDRIFTLSSDLITVANLDGYFTRVNPAVKRILGYTEEEFLARPYLAFVHPDDRERTAAEVAAIGQGKTTLSFENRYLHKDGSYRILEWTSTPVLEERATYGVARDVTDRHQAEAELARLAGEQAALRRVATLVARGIPAEELFAAVTDEVGRLLSTHLAGIARYNSDHTLTVLATWADEGEHPLVPGPWPLEGGDLASEIWKTGRPVRIDDYHGVPGPIAAFVRDELGIRASAGSPIVVAGRLWGVLFIHSKQTHQPLLPDSETRLTGFTELVAMAVANIDARAEVERLVEEQAALRRVATLVARGIPPQELFAAVAEEVGRLFANEATAVLRYDSDGSMVVGSWSRTGEGLALTGGSRAPIGGQEVSTLVFDTGRPARVDRYPADDSSAITANARRYAPASTVGAPISVEDRLWGALVVGSSREAGLPAGVEERLEKFAELVATAMANAESRSQLAASRRRIAAAADETRRRIERDLHDGIQQRLVSLGLQVRAAQAAVPTQLDEVQDELSRVDEELAVVFDELREISRGIHPAVLSDGGLEPALRALRRRSAVPVELDLHVEGRLPEPVEVAAYYVVSEGLTNAAKHAHASVVNVELDTYDAILRLAIHDDGIGGADAGHGSGLLGLRDRIEALGGTLAVTSPAGKGTTLLIKVPLEDRRRTVSPEP